MTATEPSTRPKAETDANPFKVAVLCASRTAVEVTDALPVKAPAALRERSADTARLACPARVAAVIASREPADETDTTPVSCAAAPATRMASDAEFAVPESPAVGVTNLVASTVRLAALEIPIAVLANRVATVLVDAVPDSAVVPRRATVGTADSDDDALYVPAAKRSTATADVRVAAEDSETEASRMAPTACRPLIPNPFMLQRFTWGYARVMPGLHRCRPR